jgi:hypothetical protein
LLQLHAGVTMAVYNFSDHNFAEGGEVPKAAKSPHLNL